MNWYKKAEQWYQFAPTITLYHGTTEDNLRSILREGFKPFNPDKDIEEILQEYGFSKNIVPKWIWKHEKDYREKSPYVFFTTSKKQAKLYSQKNYGEFQNSIVDNLIRWKKDSRIEIKKKDYQPIIITIDIPWEMIESSQNKNQFKQLYQSIINIKERILTLLEKGETIEDYLSSMQFEFWSKNPIPKEYITKWEYA